MLNLMNLTKLNWFIAKWWNFFCKLYYKVTTLWQSRAGITKWGKHYYKVIMLWVITRWDKSYDKIGQVIYSKVGQSLITKLGIFITKWWRYSKMGQILQSTAVHLRDTRNGHQRAETFLERNIFLLRLTQYTKHSPW